MLTTVRAITIKVDDPISRDSQLEQATVLMHRKALDCGLIVTRVNYTTFEVALSSDVRYGLTQEIDLL
jgi:hypothetical protein